MIETSFDYSYVDEVINEIREARGAKILGAKTERQQWICDSLYKLSKEPTEASEAWKGTGLRKQDIFAVTRLLAALERDRGLTDQQWVAAGLILKKYKDQVGEGPR